MSNGIGQTTVNKLGVKTKKQATALVVMQRIPVYIASSRQR